MRGQSDGRKIAIAGRIALPSHEAMTRIAVNTRLLKEGKLEGIGWFTWEGLRRIVEKHPEVTFHFIFDAPPSPQFLIHDNVVPHVLMPPARRIMLYKLWFDYLVPAKLRQIRPDLFFSPDGFCSLRLKLPQLPVMHDLNFEHHPEWLPEGVANFYRNRFPKFASIATRIATVSEFSANDISARYGVERSEIDVVYNGVNTDFRPLDEATKLKVRDQYTEGKPYFVFVGALHQRKNVDGMVKAFFQFKSRTGSPLKLVVIGEAMWNYPELDLLLRDSELRDEVVFTGRLNVLALPKVIGSALAMVFVPHFEGFGIPALESFALGVPLLASNTTAVPEVCGGAAVYADPSQIDQIADAMVRLSADAALRETCIQQGNERLKAFSWEQTASLLWESMKKSMSRD